MAVRVDEPGADDLAGRVDHAIGGRRRTEPADVSDLAALDGDVAEIGRAARAVGDPAATDEDVEQQHEERNYGPAAADQPPKPLIHWLAVDDRTSARAACAYVPRGDLRR